MATPQGPESASSTPPPLIITDLTRPRCEYYFAPPGVLNKWLLAQLRDPRDGPIGYLMFNICTTALPAAVALFLLPSSHLLGVLYLGTTMALFMQRFILGLHYAEHLRVFKDGFLGTLLNRIYPYVICNLFGIPPGIYKLHHIVMHHVENNIFPYDISSTEPYQRDSILQWFFYWMRFLSAAWLELPFYALKRRRWDFFATSVLSLAFFIVSTYTLYSRWPLQTTYVILLPIVLASFAMMFGNWSQHIFIDPARPRSNYSLAYNLINADDNLKTFNDGYHIVHHANSKLHWTELPERFLSTLDKHAQEDALVFQGCFCWRCFGLGWFDVGVLVFTGQLGKLADRYVNIGQKRRTREELIELLKSRLVPVHSAGA